MGWDEDEGEAGAASADAMVVGPAGEIRGGYQPVTMLTRTIDDDRGKSMACLGIQKGMNERGRKKESSPDDDRGVGLQPPRGRNDAQPEAKMKLKSSLMSSWMNYNR